MSDKQPKGIKTFSNNTKKFLLNAIALFIVVTITFYVESVGDEYENRQKYLDISKKILSELYLVSEYTDQYISDTDFVLPMYEKQYEIWDTDNDSIFITNIDKARKIYSYILPIIELVGQHRYTTATKAALKLMGLNVGPPRPPRLEASGSDFEWVKEVVEKYKLKI